MPVLHQPVHHPLVLYLPVLPLPFLHGFVTKFITPLAGLTKWTASDEKARSGS